jgi:hypothetical protein
MNSRTEIVALLHQTLGQATTDLFIRLLDLEVEQLKEKLITVKIEEAPETRGAIKCLRSLVADIRKNSVKTEYRDGAYA